MNHDRYAVFLDIDGTVYCHGEVVPQNRAAIRAAQAEGHKVFLNTARSLADLPPKIMEVDWDGIVAGIGCAVIAEGRRLLSVRIPPEEVARVFDLLTDRGFALMLEGDDVLLCNPLFANPGHVITVCSGAQFLAQYGERAFAKVFVDAVLPEDLQSYLRERYQFYQHGHYAEFSVKGHNKATGMQCVLDYYGIDRAHCVAMGDSINDLDMLRYAGISVAMGDAADEVKAACDRVTCRADEGGVAEALQKITDIRN